MPDEDEHPRPALDSRTREQQPDAVALPLDDLFEALADRTRRRILWYLLEESATTRPELADVLLGWGVSEDTIAGPDDRERVLSSLYHVHLPKLAEAGLVSHDPDGGAIELGSVSGPVRDLIRYGCRYERAADARDRE